MQDYRVELEIYHGPLDLLLYLIRRDEIEINDIPIHHITTQYLQYAETIRHLDINVAGEFLVMAASLMELKSAMLTPPEALTGDDGQALPTTENPEDPRYELVQQLLAYKRFKDAAYELDERRESFASRFPRHPVIPDFSEEDDQVPNLDMEDVQVYDLVEAFNRLMEQTSLNSFQHEVVDDDTPIELHAADIVDRLQRDGNMTLQEMFVGRKSVAEMIGLFIATLELVKQQRVRVFQDEVAGDIKLEVRPEDEWLSDELTIDTPVNNPNYEESDTDPSSESQGEAQPQTEPASTVNKSSVQQAEFDPTDVDAFDWPDEASRKRYARRQERRAKGEKVEEDLELEEDIKALEDEENEELVVSSDTEDEDSQDKSSQEVTTQGHSSQPTDSQDQDDTTETNDEPRA